MGFARYSDPEIGGDVLGLKTCSKCKFEKELDEFHRDKTKKDGRKSQCKICVKNDKEKKLYAKKYREENKEYYRIKNAEWCKRNAEKRRAANREYHRKNPHVSRDYYEKNKERISLYNNKYKQENKERLRVVKRAGKHKRRARKIGNGGSYTADELRDCLNYFNNRCAYTGEPLPDNYHLDHVRPLSKGGTSYIWNLVPCLAEVNTSKQADDMYGWYRRQPYYSKEKLVRINKWINQNKEREEEAI